MDMNVADGKKEFSYVVRDKHGNSLDISGCTAHLQVFNNFANSRIVNDSYVIKDGRNGEVAFPELSTFLLVGAFSFQVFLVSPLNGRMTVDSGKFYLDGR